MRVPKQPEPQAFPTRAMKGFRKTMTDYFSKFDPEIAPQTAKTPRQANPKSILGNEGLFKKRPHQVHVYEQSVLRRTKYARYHLTTFK